MMRRYGVISDIHGNLHAFLAVLQKLTELEVDDIICLGDIVGYGPRPGQCLDLVANYCGVVVRGNHDDAALDLRLANQMNSHASEAIHWTRKRLGPLHFDAMNRMPVSRHIGDRVMCIHDCPIQAPTDYIHDQYMAAASFRGVTTQICLVGHTHVPMIFEADSTDADDRLTATDITAYIGSDGVDIPLFGDRRYICNPGSVGQPRDADPRASFAVLDLDRNTFTVHREEYDIEAAQADTEAVGLPTILGERLAIGA